MLSNCLRVDSVCSMGVSESMVKLLRRAIFYLIGRMGAIMIDRSVLECVGCASRYGEVKTGRHW